MTDTQQNTADTTPQSGFLLGPGKLASLIALLTWPRGAALPIGRQIADADLISGRDLAIADFRRLYLKIGAEFLWHSRMQMSERELKAWLSDPGVELFVLTAGRVPCGMVELDMREPGLCQIAHLGLTPEARGKGHGLALLALALRRAQRPDIHTIWLATSSFDSPEALPFYLKAGFKLDRYAVEIFDDPRLSGLLPKGAPTRWPIAASRRP